MFHVFHEDERRGRSTPGRRVVVYKHLYHIPSFSSVVKWTRNWGNKWCEKTGKKHDLWGKKIKLKPAWQKARTQRAGDKLRNTKRCLCYRGCYQQPRISFLAALVSSVQSIPGHKNHRSSVMLLFSGNNKNKRADRRCKIQVKREQGSGDNRTPVSPFSPSVSRRLSSHCCSSEKNGRKKGQLHFETHFART